ncbi:MAG: hypothetical protein BAJALOKI3v1_120050 [Promethearchaeota archaeon]|nr:MAG: hypothetical protein BAJALOKI3v1_120050 [Candidatus Lokiarchaeota archaeon]
MRSKLKEERVLIIKFIEKNGGEWKIFMKNDDMNSLCDKHQKIMVKELIKEGYEK